MTDNEPLIEIRWIAFTGFVFWILGWYAVIATLFGSYTLTQGGIGAVLLLVGGALLLTSERKSDRKTPA